MTSTTTSKFDLQRWVIDVLLFWIFGAAAQFFTLWAVNLILGRTDRVGDDGVLGSLAFAAGLIAFFLFSLAKRRFSPSSSCLLAIGWWLAYFGINFLAMLAFASTGMSVIVYLASWLLLAALGAVLVNSNRTTQTAILGGIGAATAGGYVAAKQKQVLRSSDYGRIPPSTVILISQHVRTAQLAAAKLPPQVMPAFRDAAIETVLNYLLRDWWYNQNLEGLAPSDEQDIGVFVQYAWSVCRVGPQSGEEAVAVFKAVLDGMLSDWCAAWNDQTEGAPAWQWSQ